MTDSSEDTIWIPVSTSTNEEQALFIEVSSRGGREQVGLLDAIPMDKISGLLEEIASHLGEALRKTAPTKAAVELGLEFGLEEGKLVALIARGSAKANVKISLEWSKAG